MKPPQQGMMAAVGGGGSRGGGGRQSQAVLGGGRAKALSQTGFRCRPFYLLAAFSMSFNPLSLPREVIHGRSLTPGPQVLCHRC